MIDGTADAGSIPPHEEENEKLVPVAKDDIQAAWGVLENLAVSLDQIGGYFGEEGGVNNPEKRRALLDALAGYLTPSLVDSINGARMRLGKYVPDDEAEELCERLPYWDYAATPGREVGRRG